MTHTVSARVAPAGPLRAIIDEIIPVTATDPGFTDRVLGAVEALKSTHDSSLIASIEAVEHAASGGASLDQIPERDWLVRFVNAVYWGESPRDPRKESSAWSRIGWSRQPTEKWALRTPESPRVTGISPQRLADRYDAIVVGSGAGGGIAALSLAEAGLHVLVVEAGSDPSTSELAFDHLRNPRNYFGFSARTDLHSIDSPRVVGDVDEIVVGTNDPRWGGNAHLIGGGTRVYGGHAWRLTPEDLRMASIYGVPADSSLVDWPISYDDLEPHYSAVEWLVGVSGGGQSGRFDGARSREYPMPALAPDTAATVLRAGADALGWGTLPPPMLVNSVPRSGRSACVRCAQCVGFACPADAKNGVQNTVLPAAIATGRCTVIDSVQATRIEVDAGGRAASVEISWFDEGVRRARSIAFDELIIAAGAIESARLLLNSAHSREPDGLGNRHDQVGRNLQGHVYGGATGVFDDHVVDLAGPGPSIATCDFRHHNDDVIGGAMLTNGFVPTPASTWAYLYDGGLVSGVGAAGVAEFEHLASRMMRVYGPVHEIPMADSRVRVDPRVRDSRGVPVARLSGDIHPETFRTQSVIEARATEWLVASGAARVVPVNFRRPGMGPSAGQHQAGTCRMGTSPDESVTNPWGQLWGHPNVRVVDAGALPTNGGVNPVLTTMANAARIMSAMRA